MNKLKKRYERETKSKAVYKKSNMYHHSPLYVEWLENKLLIEDKIKEICVMGGICRYCLEFIEYRAGIPQCNNRDKCVYYNMFIGKKLYEKLTK